MALRTAAFPWKDGRPPHLPCGAGEVAADALLPGDPERVGIASGLLDDVRDHGRRREFRAVSGRFGGHHLTICSTGIGGPSTEIAVVELANLGVRRAIRIGGMGAVADDLPLGGLLIVTDAAGGCGTAGAYRQTEERLCGTSGIAAALAAAAKRLGVPHRTGTVMTTDSYYLGQGRPLRAGEDADDQAFIDGLRRRGIDGMDMETEALFAVGARMGIETGAVLAVHGHRGTGRWLEDYEPAQRAVVQVAAMALADRAKA